MPANVYFVTALSGKEKVRTRLTASVDSGDYFELADDRWMVSYTGSAQELAEKVGVRGEDDRVGTGLALAVTTYSGRAPTGLWDWLRSKGL